MRSYMVLLLGLSLMVSCVTFEDEQDTTLSDAFKSIDGEPVVPRKANNLFLTPIANWTGNIQLESKLVIKLKEAINTDGRLVVVPDKDRSDLQLDVAVKEYSIQNVEFGGSGEPTKKRMRIVVGVALLNIEKKKMIFTDPVIQSFQVFSENVPPISSESQVLDSVLDNLVKRIASKAVSGWYTQYMTPIEKAGK